MRAPVPSTLFALTALSLCAGCVGGKLFEGGGAIIDDERNPRPYPGANLANPPKAGKLAVQEPIGTGVAATVASPAETAKPAIGATDEVTISNLHQHLAEHSNVSKIPPTRIKIREPGDMTGYYRQRLPPIVDTDEYAKAWDQIHPFLADSVQQLVLAKLIEETALQNDAPDSTVRNEQALTPESAPDVETPAVSLPTIDPAPTKSADDLLPSDPTERAAWLQTRYVTALEAALKDVRSAGNKEAAARLDQHLRLAYLLAERPDDAARGVEDLPEAERESYKQLMFGLAQFLGEEDARRPAHRNARVAKSLREALRELTTASRLELRNVAFCERVEQFGWFTEFRKQEFSPKQQVILYVEVENATAEEKGQHNFETELAGSYQVFDDAGKLVQERTLPLDKETCRNYRRDYFLAYRIYLPDDIAPGHYRLELTVEDLKAKRSGNRKLGEAQAEFRVR